MQQPAENLAAAPPATVQAGALVAKNTFLLVFSQVLTTPLSLLVNVIMGRYLGAEDFGILYLFGTVTAFAFLVVEWGSSAALPALVARQPSRSGALFGSATGARLPLSLVGYLVCAATLIVLGYPMQLQAPFAVAFLLGLIGSLNGINAAVLRGHEQIAAVVKLNVATALLAVLPLVALFLGARLMGWLWANVATAFVALCFGVILLRRLAPQAAAVRWRDVRELFATGTPFLVLGGVLALQPYVDTLILARLAPAEVMGWHAAARRIVGLVIFPTTAIAGAIYPTLSRLHAGSEAAWKDLTQSALAAVAILSVPAALGCALFASDAIALYSRSSFGPAAENLAVMSGYVFLVYVTIVIGTALMAAGKQKPWAVAQSLCVVVSLVVDPLLIPVFQRRMGNGGLGVAVSTVASEVLMIAAAVAIAPRGTWGAGFLRAMARALVAGSAMVATAFATSSWPWPPRVAVSFAAYAVVLFAAGGVGSEARQIFQDVIASRLRRYGGSARNRAQ